MSLSWSKFTKIPKTKKELKTKKEVKYVSAPKLKTARKPKGGSTRKRKAPSKLKDVSIRKHKAEVKKRAKKAASTGNKRYDAELRLMQKRANERMRQLELKGIDSPAYRAVQAKLEILGKKTKGARGRRFSETGKGTYNERELQKRILKEFLESKTSTLTGSKDYYDRVWDTANKNNGLESAGISRDQWFSFFDNMPDKKKDRMFYSQQVKIFKSFMNKNGELVNEGKITIEEIADSIQEAEKLNEVLDNLNDLYLEAVAAGAEPDEDGFITLKDI